MNLQWSSKAIHQRDALEIAWITKLPHRLRPYGSELVSRITGIAPSSTEGKPNWKGSETRSVAYHLLMLAFAFPMLLFGNPVIAGVGSLLWISFARGLVSGFGHHLTHRTSRLPWPAKYTILAYDMIGAIGWFATYADYRHEHGKHHAFVAASQDPDRQFLLWVGTRLNSWPCYLGTLFNPRVHTLFLLARLRGVFSRGPIWRRFLGLAFLLAASTLNAQALLKWLLIAGLGYQLAAITSWLSLHLWESRPDGMGTKDAGTAVTFARLMIPTPTVKGILLHFPTYALAKAVFLQSDRQQHVLHHIGVGPWTEAPYRLTKALLEGHPILVTTTLREMFELPMKVAANKPRSLPSDRQFWLGM